MVTTSLVSFGSLVDLCNFAPQYARQLELAVMGAPDLLNSKEFSFVTILWSISIHRSRTLQN